MKRYEQVDIEIILFTMDDVITGSGIDFSDQDGWNQNWTGGAGGKIWE